MPQISVSATTIAPPAAARSHGLGMNFFICRAEACSSAQNSADTHAHSAASIAARTSPVEASAGMTAVKRTGATPSHIDSP